jgi:hypothetical protein
MDTGYRNIETPGAEVLRLSGIQAGNGIIQAGGTALHTRTDLGQSRVRKVVEQASRRNRFVLVVEHSAFALAALFGGIVLLLLLGTQILNWPWLVLLVLVGEGVVVMRVRARVLSRYRVAQIVDHRLALSDSLSTAWFLLQDAQTPVDAFAREQIHRAENVARDLKPASVFPYVWRRTWALTIALAAVAFGLFALRYLVTRSLNFEQALIPHPFSLPAEIFERLQRFAQPGRKSGREANKGVDSGVRRQADTKRGEPSSIDERAAKQQPGKSGETDRQRNATDPKTRPLGAKQASDSSDPSTSSEKSQTMETGQNGRAPDGHAKKENQPPQEARQDTDHQPSSGLLDQMKDALSGLMAKMRPQSAEQDDKQRGQQDSKPGQQNNASNSRNPQTQSNARDSRDRQSERQQQGAQGQQEAQASEKSPPTQSHAADESANSKSSDAQSGIGRQDGEKTLKTAEQLRAMGKLDEIIGKRSSSLTGDMVVETHSGHQQLQTQYSGRVGHHADLGGEIDRDEVPVALQQYVREYMEQVRKQANNEP